jgi:shikimate kinase
MIAGDPAAALQRLAATRDAAYRASADAVVDADRPVDQVADQVVARFEAGATRAVPRS